MIELFLLLVFGHLLADFPLQGDFLARAKNHKAPLPGVPWFYALLAHAGICGGFVWAAVFACTGNADAATGFAISETIVHSATDWMKNEGHFGDEEVAFLIDQAIHILQKAWWTFMLYVSGVTFAS